MAANKRLANVITTISEWRLWPTSRLSSPQSSGLSIDGCATANAGAVSTPTFGRGSRRSLLLWHGGADLLQKFSGQRVAHLCGLAHQCHAG